MRQADIRGINMLGSDIPITQDSVEDMKGVVKMPVCFGIGMLQDNRSICSSRN